MIQFSILVDAPQEDTFETFTNLDRSPEILSDVVRVEVLDEGSIGAGTRFRETRKMFGKEHSETLQFSEFDPGSGYTLSCTSCGCEFTSRFRFSSEGEGTRVQMDMESRPVTLFARIVTPITGFMMRGSMRKAIEKDLFELKQAAEAAG